MGDGEVVNGGFVGPLAWGPHHVVGDSQGTEIVRGTQRTSQGSLHGALGPERFRLWRIQLFSLSGYTRTPEPPNY